MIFFSSRNKGYAAGALDIHSVFVISINGEAFFFCMLGENIALCILTDHLSNVIQR